MDHDGPCGIGADARRGRVLGAAVAVIVLVAAVVGASPEAQPVEAAPLAEARFVGTPGPLGPITVIGDSVMVGATVEPSLPNLLAQRGWGPGPVPRRARLLGGELPAGRTRGLGGELDPLVERRRLGRAERGRQRREQRRRLLRVEHRLQREHDPLPDGRDRPGPHRVVEQDHAAPELLLRPDRIQPGTRPRRRRAVQPADLGLADGGDGQFDRHRSRRRAPERRGELPPAVGPDGRRHHHAARDRVARRRRRADPARSRGTDGVRAAGAESPPRHPAGRRRPVAGRWHPRRRSRRRRTRRCDRGRREPHERQPRRGRLSHGVSVRPVAADRRRAPTTPAAGPGERSPSSRCPLPRRSACTRQLRRI